VLSSRTRRSGSRAAALLRLAAVTVGRNALGAFYRRLSARIGKVKAITATARKIAILFYNALGHGIDYVDPGASSYEARYRARVIDNLHRRAKAFGFVLQPMAPAPVSWEKPACGGAGARGRGVGAPNRACLTRPVWSSLMRPLPIPKWCG
jgi:transposase